MGTLLPPICKCLIDVDRTIIEYAILLWEDAHTHNRLAALLNFCVDQQLTVSPKKILPRRQLVLVSPSVQRLLHHLTPTHSNSKAREKDWINDVDGSPADFVHKGKKRGFLEYSMCSSTVENDRAFLRQLGVPENQQVYLRTRNIQGSPVIVSLWSGLNRVQTISTLNQSVVLDWSADTVLLFWKAFCLLKERQDHLFAQSIDGRSGLVDVTSTRQDKLRTYHQQPQVRHGRLVGYYQDRLSKDSLSTKLRVISLPQQETVRGGRQDFPATTAQSSEVRLVLARPHHVNGEIRAACTKFFDVGSGCVTESRPGGIKTLTP